MQILGSLLPINICPFLCSGISPQKIQNNPSGFHRSPLQINSTHITLEYMILLIYIYILPFNRVNETSSQIVQLSFLRFCINHEQSLWFSSHIVQSPASGNDSAYHNRYIFPIRYEQTELKRISHRLKMIRLSNTGLH